MDAETKQDRRCKVWWVPQEKLIEIFSGRLEIHGFPPDARITSVTACWERRSIGLMVESQSFDIVPDGMYAPDMEPLGITYEPAIVPTCVLKGLGSYPSLAADIQIVDEALGQVGETRRAWESLRSHLRPIGMIVKAGTECVERPDGTVKFREFL